jgi:hypothetical protein
LRGTPSSAVATERVNHLYFLSKWPDVEVELAVAFGDFEANGEAGK